MKGIFRKVLNVLKADDKKVVINNFLSLVLLQGANYILPLLILPHLVRVLGAEKFGLIMFAQSLIVFLTVFIEFGFTLSGTREISLAKDNISQRSKIFMAIMSIKMLLLIGIFLVLYAIVTVFPRFSVDKEVYLFSFGIVIGQALFPAWFFQGIEKMKFVTMLNILAKTCFTILVFVLVRHRADYIFVPVYNSLGFILAGVSGLLICFKYVKIQKPSLVLMKQFFLESLSLFVSNFAVSLYTASNTFILGLFVGNTIVGVYSSMEKLVLAAKNIYVPIYQALFPWVARQLDGEKLRTTRKLMPIIFVIGLLMFLALFIFARDILTIIYDNQLITSYAIIFRILSSIALFSGMNMLYTMLYFPSIKEYKIRMNILVLGGLFNIALALIFVRFFGIYATAVVVSSTELLLLLVGYAYYQKFRKQG
ncbi:MAG: oligosaccharide flippase family protein [Bacteroidota bacterium]